ncbi:MAG: SgcJ/EcaC family oxidoreductase [Alphaproteobacteria bacterium]|nr:SgcJ/EcaC family oxidoreductase [Alphaproteobacteria bacterium]
MTQMMRPDDVPAAFQAAWNADDMMDFGALFHDDATFVNRFAHLVRGVGEIVALHRGIHETIYRDSILENELIAVDPIGDGVAVVHFWGHLTTGPAHPAGPHQVDTLILAVVTRAKDGWRIRAAENVTLADPRTGQPVLRH